MTQLVDPPWSVGIAEKVWRGLPYPCVVLISASAMPVASQRAVRLRGMTCGITRVSLTCFTKSWDRAILARVNTWVDLESDPTSCSRIIPVLVKCWDSLPLLVDACLCVWDSQRPSPVLDDHRAEAHPASC